jgi:glycerol-3-phosphate acyltransferase PlsY
MAMLLVVKHKDNITKLIEGTESKLGFGRKTAK